MSEAEYDLVVVGGGIGGLATATLAQRLGLRVALLEAHTKLGGCAGYFDRGPYTFDVGATALMGLKEGEAIGDLIRVVGAEFSGQPTSSYRVNLPDRVFDIVPDDAAFEKNTEEAFPGLAREKRAFWRLQNAVGRTLLNAAGDLPRLPVRSLSDLVHDIRVLGVRGILSGLTSLVTVRDVLRVLGLDEDLPFRSLVAMLLQDTAQAGPETVPFANAAACLQAYRMGMCRPRGGMKALAEGLGHRFAELGGELRTATLVDRIQRTGTAGFTVMTRQRRRLSTRQVALNLPLDLAARLLGWPLEKTRVGRLEHQSRAVWSAFTGYLAIERAAVPDDSPLFHQVLQSYDRPIHDGNNVLISLSPVEDEGYGPRDVRIATMSTHTAPSGWYGLEPVEYEARKADYRSRMLGALARAIPEAPGRLIHAEFATPRSFLRYTRRREGLVGGPSVSRRNSNFLAVGSDVFGPGIWVVGDSVFPGQGTMAVVLSALRVVERITGSQWSEVRSRTWPAQESFSPVEDVAIARFSG